MANGHFVLLCVAHFILGTALIGVNFIRFAASENVPKEYQANALSLVLASGLVAALLGPTVFDMSKDAWQGFEYAGAYFAIGILGLLGCLPVLAMTEKADNSNSTDAPSVSVQKPRSRLQVLKDPKVATAILVAATSQAVMIMLMVPTPLAMIDLGHASDHASDVIRWHVVAMFAPGLITGWLIKRMGVTVIINIGMGLLAFAAFVALAGIELNYFYLSLILLGVGWNFGFIGGTHLLQQSITADERGSVQGLNDTALAICGSAASIASGALYVGIGWTYVSYVSIALLVVSVAVVLLVSRR